MVVAKFSPPSDPIVDDAQDSIWRCSTRWRKWS